MAAIESPETQPANNTRTTPTRDCREAVCVGEMEG